jgi:transcriptional regulator with XRE-family HTH domain
VTARRRREPSGDTTQFLVGLAAVARTIRAREKLSQAEVAQRGGVGKKLVSAVENGTANPSITDMGQLAEGLGLAGAAELASRAEQATRRLADAPLRPTE